MHWCHLQGPAGLYVPAESSQGATAPLQASHAGAASVCSWKRTSNAEHTYSTAHSHAHLDLVRCLKAVKLVEQLKHGALHLAVAAARAALTARAADAVHLVHEDDARRMLPRHHKQLTHLRRHLLCFEAQRASCGCVRTQSCRDRLCIHQTGETRTVQHLRLTMHSTGRQCTSWPDDRTG